MTSLLMGKDQAQFFVGGRVNVIKVALVKKKRRNRYRGAATNRRIPDAEP